MKKSYTWDGKFFEQDTEYEYDDLGEEWDMESDYIDAYEESKRIFGDSNDYKSVQKRMEFIRARQARKEEKIRYEYDLHEERRIAEARMREEQARQDRLRKEAEERKRIEAERKAALKKIADDWQLTPEMAKAGWIRNNGDVKFLESIVKDYPTCIVRILLRNKTIVLKQSFKFNELTYILTGEPGDVVAYMLLSTTVIKPFDVTNLDMEGLEI